MSKTTKMSAALKIYKALQRRKSEKAVKAARKDGLAKFVAELEMTDGQAARYWQICRTKAAAAEAE